MTEILIALLIGIVAGAIDIAPMFKPEIPRFSVYHVFAQWVFIGLVIPFINWDIQPWLKGLIIAEIGMIPVMIIAFYRNKKRVPSIAFFAALLGLGIGFLGDVLIR